MAKATYKDYHIFVKNRISALQDAECRCIICNKDADCVHHADMDKANHEPENLLVLCNGCHRIMHKEDDPEKTRAITRYERVYGMSIKKMVAKFGGSRSRYYLLHRQGLLKAFLAGDTYQPPPQSSKYFRAYGVHLSDMIKLYGGSANRYKAMHDNGSLVDFMKNPFREPKKTKFTTLYGLTLQQMVNKHGKHHYFYRNLHLDGKLGKWLENHK